jgi:nucleoside-diphosphate-sugar epimerase
MWLANNHPERDLANILALHDRLEQVKAGRAVLISTIAVYADPAARPDELTEDGFEQDKAYGRHRRRFEEMVTKLFRRLLIVRLPALFGPGLAKNFIFDLLNPVPSFLPAERMASLKAKLSEDERAIVDAAFEPDAASNLFRFRRKEQGEPGRAQAIAEILERQGIAARNFTNSRSRFQFYNLEWLWNDIERALAADLPALNLATEPLLAADIALRLTGKPFDAETAPRVEQDMRSRHCSLWGREDGYLHGARAVLDALAGFYARESGS